MPMGVAQRTPGCAARPRGALRDPGVRCATPGYHLRRPSASVCDTFETRDPGYHLRRPSASNRDAFETREHRLLATTAFGVCHRATPGYHLRRPSALAIVQTTKKGVATTATPSNFDLMVANPKATPCLLDPCRFGIHWVEPHCIHQPQQRW